MSELPYMPWYVNDFRGDTQHLALEARGAYRDILDELWVRGGSIKFDERRLSRMLAVTPAKFRKIWTEIGDMFCLEGGNLSHKRVTLEIEKARKSIKKRSEVAKNAAKKRWEKSKENSETTVPKAMLAQCQSESEPEGSGIPLKGDTMNLPPDGALAVERLRAAAETGHKANEIEGLLASIAGWDDGTFFLTGKYVCDRFTESLSRELRAEGLTLAVGSKKPKAEKPKPKLTAIDGGRS